MKHSPATTFPKLLTLPPLSNRLFNPQEYSSTITQLASIFQITEALEGGEQSPPSSSVSDYEKNDSMPQKLRKKNSKKLTPAR